MFVQENEIYNPGTLPDSLDTYICSSSYQGLYPFLKLLQIH